MDGRLFLKSCLISVFIQKEAKKSQKIERSQTKFLVAKRSQKKPKSRNLALLTPNWQPCSDKAKR
jgi:hypothetical protein